jgi:hypothetical protein
MQHIPYGQNNYRHGQADQCTLEQNVAELFGKPGMAPRKATGPGVEHGVGHA